MVFWYASPNQRVAFVADGAGPEGGPGGLRGRPAHVAVERAWVQGRVVDLDHAGIEGASVVVDPRETSTLEGDSPAGVTTGRDGAFRISIAADGRKEELAASAAGYVPTRWDLGRDGTEKVEIVLRPFFELGVHVIDQRDRPLPRAVIVTNNGGGSEASLELGVTDENGRLVTRRLGRPGQYHVWAKHKLGSTFVPVRVTKEDVRLDVTLRMPETMIARGRVVDALGEEPIAGARVTQGVPVQRETMSDKEGRFEIPLPLTFDTQASYAGLYAYAAGYAPTRVELRTADEVVIRLRRGPRHSGHVVDSGARPIAMATVTISLTPGEVTGFNQTLVTSRVSDERGGFEFSEVRVGTGMTLVIAADGFGSTVTDLIALPDGGDLGSFVLQPGLTITGTVRTQEGTALDGCRIGVTGSASALKPNSSWSGSSYQEGRIEKYVSTSEAGLFRVADLAPGVYRVTAWPRGTPPFGTTVDLPESEAIEIRLPEDRVLRVTVVGPDGAPVPGSLVSVGGKLGSGSDVTDSHGRAVLRIPRSAGVEIFVQGDSLGDLAPVHNHRVGVQETDVRISLARKWDVSGAVRGLGDDAFGTEVEVAAADGKWSLRTLTHATGWFSVATPGPDFEPFTCRLTGFRGEKAARGNVGTSRSGYEGQAIGVRAGERDVVIEAIRSAAHEESRLRVVSPAGVGVEGAFVAYLDMEARMMMSVSTDENGRAVFRGLSRGQTISVTARPDRADRDRRGWLASLPVEVQAGGTRETTIPLRAARRIVGKVTSADGAAIEGATVELLRTTPDGLVPLRKSISDRGGEFELVFDEMMLLGEPPRLRAQSSTARSPTVLVAIGAENPIVLVVD
jgi:hypothetical protein